MSSTRNTLQSLYLAAGLIAIASGGARAAAPVAFETGQVRPLALSADGLRLYAINTPAATLEVLGLESGRPERLASIPVGLEPIAVAVRSEREVWVVNHLSDSISIVDPQARTVVRTLLVGDEPRDLVFARDAQGRERAFVTTAHRGQHRTHPSLAGVPGAGDPQLSLPGVPRADVWVFDAEDPGPGLGGRPLKIVELFGDTPRALAVRRTAAGDSVLAAVFHSGNRTTVVSEGVVCDGFVPELPCLALAGWIPGGNPRPAESHAGAAAPEVGLILRQDGAGKWRDELGRNWTAAVRFNLPDYDVFEIGAGSLQQTRRWSGVGTVLFNLAVNPVSGVVYVSNSEARNEVRFEGPGAYVTAQGGKGGPRADPATVQGRLHEMRVTLLDGDRVVPRHLNAHIDYAQRPAPTGTAQHSLSIPTGMAVSADGATLYVTAFGSRRLGVLKAAELDAGFDPRTASARYIDLACGAAENLNCGGGPSGVVLDEARQRAYVLTRFDNAVATVNLQLRRRVARLLLPNPEAPAVIAGRPLLYDARHASSNGEASCASCHVFGDLDSLAWDLGNPDGEVGVNPAPLINRDNVETFHPMKGPMTTQTLRGMVNHGAMHWRGDRVSAADPFDSTAAFMAFAPAFEGLVGRAQPIPNADMQRFTGFALALTQPPNPVRALDNSLPPEVEEVLRFFMGRPHRPELFFSLFPEPVADALPFPVGVKFPCPEPCRQLFASLYPTRKSDGLPFDGSGMTCFECHTTDPGRGHFGTDGRGSFEFETQIMKVPHLRSLYQKVGMFGSAPTTLIPRGTMQHQGDQVRGFGFLHDGSVDTLFRFFNALVFTNTVVAGFQGGDAEMRAMEQFMLQFDSDLAPIVGQQVTLRADNQESVLPRVELLMQRAAAPFASQILGGAVTECDLVVRGVLAGRQRTWRYAPGEGLFKPAAALTGPVGLDKLKRLATGGAPLTFTCLPPG